MKTRTFKILTFILCTVILTSCSKENIEDQVTSYDQVATKKAEYKYSQMEIEILEDINIYRKANGLSELKALTDVSLKAEDHNDYMIQNGKVSHDNFAARASYLMNEIGAKSVSENVAYGYHTADAVVKAWLKSSAHKENIDGDHTHFGISVRQDSEGKNYFTNIFIKK
ncbi:CAP domain-containing protein [Christiangramia salexigens]|uniref:SCP domain-containing protein n=1 Tax=Christiangramia salexigens TaxID=1913577 RepID=A0A1L3J2Q6_9FLAO|nr:CAP domain-containing protein [Christiangramia salexigens]APG59405.1 hypothetical protein LPB144_02825 [Christiangramia salexigens]